jgi:cytoskeleton protein RodZ
MTRTHEFSPVRAAAHEQASRWLVLGLALAALIALGLIGWYATRGAESAAVAPARTAIPATGPSAPANERPVPVMAPVTNAATEGAPAPAMPTGPAAADGSSADAAAQTPAADTDAALLVLTFSGLSWVEVTDANGTVLVSHLAREGEVLQPAGTTPLAVVVGDAAQVTATVRGAAFNLEPVTRANVARFTVE